MRWLRMRPVSLRGRILRDIGLGLLLVAACHALALTLLYRAGSEMLVHNGLVGQAEDLAESLSISPDGVPRLDLSADMAWGYDAYVRHLKYRVLDAEGRVRLSSEGDVQPLVRDAGGVVLGEDRFTAMRDGVALQAVTIPVTVDGHALWIQAARSDRFLALAEEAILPVAVDTSLLAGGFALALFGVVVWRSLHRALQPVRAASCAAAEIGPRNPSARVPCRGMPSEIRPLIDAVNGGLSRLEAAYVAQQRFLANAAHELKTPLTVLRGRLELDGDCEVRGPALEEVDRMSRIVGQLLHLAEAGDPNTYRIAPVSLSRVAMRARALLVFAAEAKDVTIKVELAGMSPPCKGDESALVTAVRNVLENAIRHSPPGSRVRIVVDGCAIRVLDEGQGVPTEALARAFDRFWRADRNGDGAGLGLAIVRDVMHAHGGKADLRNRRGRGAECSLVLPQPR